MKLTMTVDVRDDRIVARLAGARPAVLTRDTIADLFLDAVWAALEDTEPDVDGPVALAVEVAETPAPAPANEPVPDEPPPPPTDPAAVYRETLRRLDAGEDRFAIAHSLRITPRQVRQWDEDPGAVPVPLLEEAGRG